jgi:hypothetical protein
MASSILTPISPIFAIAITGTSEHANDRQAAVETARSFDMGSIRAVDGGRSPARQTKLDSLVG